MPFAESRELQERFRAHRLGKLQRRLCPQVEEEVPVLRQEEEERRVSPVHQALGSIAAYHQGGPICAVSTWSGL